jgi:hypothetical protein
LTFAIAIQVEESKTNAASRCDVMTPIKRAARHFSLENLHAKSRD